MWRGLAGSLLWFSVALTVTGLSGLAAGKASAKEACRTFSAGPVQASEQRAAARAAVQRLQRDFDRERARAERQGKAFTAGKPRAACRETGGFLDTAYVCTAKAKGCWKGAPAAAPLPEAAGARAKAADGAAG